MPSTAVVTRVDAKMSYGPLAGRWRDVVAVERRSPRVT